MLHLPLPAPPPGLYAPIQTGPSRGLSLDVASLACIFRLQEKTDTMSRFPETLPSTITPGPAERSRTLPSDASNPSPNPAPNPSTSSTTSLTLVYRQRVGYYAVHYVTANVEASGAEFVMADDAGGAIAVFKGDAPVSRSLPSKSSEEAGNSANVSEDQITPVYTADNGVAAVPTGQVFIRFAEGVDARERAAELQAAGYVTVKVLDFAPQGAWVRASSGSIADGLQQLQSLEGLEKLEKIEPQMLMQRSLR